MSAQDIPPLPEGYLYHVYLSYSNTTCIHVGEEQELLLFGRNYSVMKGDVNQIPNCFCFVLILSMNAWQDELLKADVMAFRNEAERRNFDLKTRMLILVHPDTDMKVGWTIQDYITTAPNFIQQHLRPNDFIHLQVRGYLKKAINEEIDKRYIKMFNSVI